MKIERIKIQNYKSIRDIDIFVSPYVNVFIGENSVGKSNIFSAIEWLLGPVYPSFNSFQREDYFRGDNSLPVQVALKFDDGHTLEMTSKWYYRGYEKSGLNLDYNYVSDDDRQRYVSASIGADRRLAENPATNRWTLMGRLLLDINKQFQKEEMTDPQTGETIKKTDYFKQSMQHIRDFTLFSVQDQKNC